MNQKSAAKAAAIPQGSWSFIERGERDPSLVQAFRIELLTGGEIPARDWVSEKELARVRLRRKSAVAPRTTPI